MLSQQDEDHRQSTVNRSMSPRVTPLINDHVHIQHRNFNDNAANNEQIRQPGDASLTNDDITSIYGRANDETPTNSSTVYHSRNANTHIHVSRQFSGDFNVSTARSESKGGNCVNDKSSCGKCKTIGHGKRAWDSGCPQKKRTQELANAQPMKQGDSTYWRNVTNNANSKQDSHNRGYEHNIHPQSSNYEGYKTHDCLPSRDANTLMEDYKAPSKQFVRNDGNFKPSIL